MSPSQQSHSPPHVSQATTAAAGAGTPGPSLQDPRPGVIAIFPRPGHHRSSLPEATREESPAPKQGYSLAKCPSLNQSRNLEKSPSLEKKPTPPSLSPNQTTLPNPNNPVCSGSEGFLSSFPPSLFFVLPEVSENPGTSLGLEYLSLENPQNLPHSDPSRPKYHQDHSHLNEKEEDIMPVYSRPVPDTPHFLMCIER